VGTHSNARSFPSRDLYTLLMLNIIKPYPELFSFTIWQGPRAMSHPYFKDDPPSPILDLLWSSHSEPGQLVNLIQSIEFWKLLPRVSVVWTPPPGLGTKAEGSSDSEWGARSSFHSWENIGTCPRSAAYTEGFAQITRDEQGPLQKCSSTGGPRAAASPRLNFADPLISVSAICWYL
jgi:hypothetical protein